MATHDVNLADRSGQLLESHRGYDPRIIFFYFVLAVLIITLAVGLGYQQLQRTSEHNETERQQSQRLQRQWQDLRAPRLQERQQPPPHQRQEAQPCTAKNRQPVL
mgnify:CR=1 FL=1